MRIPQELKLTSAAFVADKRGNFGVAMAVMLVPLVLAVGLALDYSQVSSVRSKNQNALDAAVWAGALESKDTSDADRTAKMQQVYQANGGRGTVKLLKVEKNTDNIGVKASAAYDAPTSIMAIAGYRTVPTLTSAGVNIPMKVTTALIKTDMAKGRWDKTMTMIGKIKSGDSVPILKIEYKPDSDTYDQGKSTIFTFDARGEPQAVSGSQASVEVGRYDELVMQMEITASDKRVKRDFLGYSDDAAGLAKADGVTVNYPRLFASDDKALVHRMFTTSEKKNPTTGVKTTVVEQNKGTDLLSRLGCDETEKQSWEDGGSYTNTEIVRDKQYRMNEGNYNSWETNGTAVGNEKATDFRYFVTGKCDVTSTEKARLTN